MPADTILYSFIEFVTSNAEQVTDQYDSRTRICVTKFFCKSYKTLIKKITSGSFIKRNYYTGHTGRYESG